MLKTKKISKLLALVLTLAMVLSLFSVTGAVTASAESAYGTYVNTTTTVKFNNIDWYVIADNSTAVNEGTVTLFASQPILNKSTYHESSNEYNVSDIKNALDSLTANGGSFAAVADMIKSVDLTDVNVSGAKLYLLSKSEVEAITNEEILLCTTTALGDLQTNASWWWLRTPGDNNKVWCVDARTTPEGSSRLKANGIDTARNIRPALQLDLSKVTFDAETKTFIMGNEVARVTVDGTSTYYTSFADALAAWVSGSTLTLLADVEITERILIYDTRTIDLNGYGIKRIGNDQVFAIDTADASLTINDGEPTRTDTGSNRPNGVVGGYLTGGNNNDTYGWGGGIYLGNGATLTMNGGTITGNMANGNGGGVVVSGSTFIMTGGTISGNNAYNDGWGGGVFVYTNAVFNVSGTPVICDNYKGTTLSNVHLQMYDGSATINVVSPGLNDGANIGVTMMFSDVFTSSSNTEYNVASYFTDDSAERTVVKNDDGQLLFDGPVYIFDAESSSDPSYKLQVDIPTTNGIDNTTKVEALINMESLADDGWAQMQVIYDNWSQNKSEGISAEPGIAKYTLDYSDIDKSKVKLFIQLVGKAKLLALTVTNSDGTTKTYGSWTAPVTYKVVGGTWSDDSNDEITEDVQKGSKPASIPTGMKASEGYTGEGSWDVDPTNATITEAATFTYTFEAIPTATVSPSADAGTVTVEETTLYHSYPDYWSFTAAPKDGYKFVKWTCNYDGSPVTKFENPYRIPKDNMDKLTDLTAVFESDGSANTPYTDFLVTTDANKTKSGDDLTALQVTFNGKPWYIIEDNSTADSDPTVTLFAADTSFGVSAFSDNESNAYSDSVIKSALWALTSSGSFKDVSGAIADVYLEDVDSSGKLYLLSTDEASMLPSNVLKIEFSGTSNASYAPWWLRSKAGHEGNVAQVYLNGHIDSGYGAAVTEVFGVRPALKLDLSKVKFDSESKTFTLDNSITILFSSLPQMKIEKQIIDASQVDVTIKNTYSNTVKAAIAEEGSGVSYTDVPSGGTYKLSGGKYKITEANANGTTKYFTFAPIEESTYTVTYDANGGTGTVPTDTHTYAKGDYVNFENPGELKNDGYEFIGWNTDPDADTGLDPYQMGEENVTFYAVWEAIPVIEVEVGRDVNVDTFMLGYAVSAAVENEAYAATTVPNVDYYFTVTGVAEGSTTVTLTYEDRSGTLRVKKYIVNVVPFQVAHVDCTPENGGTATVTKNSDGTYTFKAIPEKGYAFDMAFYNDEYEGGSGSGTIYEDEYLFDNTGYTTIIVHVYFKAVDDETPDEATPDDATPDEATPDEATPDEATPDEATPDEATPDEATPDEPTPDEPDKPDNPDEPDKPDKPDNPDKPDDPEPKPETKGLLGDVNNDGVVDAIDALLILRASLQLDTFDAVQTFLGDVDGDAIITSNDALEVLRYSIQLPANENIGTEVKIPEA